MKCSGCGSSDQFLENGYLICNYCRSKNRADPRDIPQKETIISINSDIEKLIEKCKSDPDNCRRYANLILDIDPTNQEAHHYLI